MTQRKDPRRSQRERWTPEEDRVIARHYPDYGALTCQRYMRLRSISAIISRAADLKVKKIHKHAHAWTESENDVIREFYPEKGVEGCECNLPKRTSKAIQAQAARIGIQMLSEKKKLAGRKTIQETCPIDLTAEAVYRRNESPKNIALCGRWV